jgi:hypothetical protein
VTDASATILTLSSPSSLFSLLLSLSFFSLLSHIASKAAVMQHGYCEYEHCETKDVRLPPMGDQRANGSKSKRDREARKYHCVCYDLVQEQEKLQKVFDAQLAWQNRTPEEKARDARREAKVAAREAELDRLRLEQEQAATLKLEQEIQTRRQHAEQAQREAHERDEKERMQKQREAERVHQEIQRRTRLYKFNITTKLDKKRFKKLALTEPVFVFEADMAAEYRQLRQEAAHLMHTQGPFSGAAMAAHTKFEVFHKDTIMWQLPSMGLEYDEASGRFWMDE